MEKAVKRAHSSGRSRQLLRRNPSPYPAYYYETPSLVLNPGGGWFDDIKFTAIGAMSGFGFSTLSGELLKNTVSSRLGKVLVSNLCGLLTTGGISFLINDDLKKTFIAGSVIGIAVHNLKELAISMIEKTQTPQLTGVPVPSVKMEVHGDRISVNGVPIAFDMVYETLAGQVKAGHRHINVRFSRMTPSNLKVRVVDDLNAIKEMFGNAITANVSY